MSLTYYNGINGKFKLRLFVANGHLTSLLAAFFCLLIMNKKYTYMFKGLLLIILVNITILRVCCKQTSDAIGRSERVRDVFKSEIPTE